MNEAGGMNEADFKDWATVTGLHVEING